MSVNNADNIETALPRATPPEMKAALKQFIDNLTNHSRKNSELIDVLVQALRTVNQELQQQKLKNTLLEARVNKTDARVDELSQVMAAFRRQGWLQ